MKVKGEKKQKDNGVLGVKVEVDTNIWRGKRLINKIVKNVLIILHSLLQRKILEIETTSLTRLFFHHFYLSVFLKWRFSPFT